MYASIPNYLIKLFATLLIYKYKDYYLVNYLKVILFFCDFSLFYTVHNNSTDIYFLFISDAINLFVFYFLL